MKQSENSMEHDDNVIRLRNLAICHSEGILLQDVNLDIRRGEFVYLIGKSGSGKTSLLRSLYGDHAIASGEAAVCGYDLTRLKRRQVPMLRRQIGIVFQNYRLLKDRNVYENLAFVLKATGWKKRDEMDRRIMETLESVGVKDKALSMPQRLSEGEQQRVGIARALINNPSLILADETTGNMDPITSSEIIELLQRINREDGVTMLIASHDFMMIDKFPSRVICCEDGTLVSPE
ncbi:MAG: cell division ABC transporter, ATP binding component [bacterium P3]|nr:MAG: cell division ABC transporter, ATP binding component [bacterium P3]KWW42371.1 MAG: cell division ABC transporter, ATP binding component [bacterium F083]